MNKRKLGFILLIGYFGVLTLISCSSDDSDGPPPPLGTSSSSVEGNSSSSGDGYSSSDGGDGDSSSSADDDSSSSVGDSSSSDDGGGDSSSSGEDDGSSSSVGDSSSSGGDEGDDSSSSADNSSSSEDDGGGDSSSSEGDSSSSDGSIVSCPNPSVSDNSVSCGGQTYRTVNINGQVWFAENLNYAANGSRCYDDDPANCDIYGRLYDWSTARSVCPNGWHLPSDEEWTALENAVGGSSTAGTKLKATSGWNADATYGNGTDDYGFSALPGGAGYSNGYFNSVGSLGYWWSASEDTSSNAWFRNMNYLGSGAGRGVTNKPDLLSVRCVQDG